MNFFFILKFCNVKRGFCLLQSIKHTEVLKHQLFILEPLSLVLETWDRSRVMPGTCRTGIDPSNLHSSRWNCWFIRLCTSMTWLRARSLSILGKGAADSFTRCNISLSSWANRTRWDIACVITYDTSSFSSMPSAWSGWWLASCWRDSNCFFRFQSRDLIQRTHHL